MAFVAALPAAEGAVAASAGGAAAGAGSAAGGAARGAAAAKPAPKAAPKAAPAASAKGGGTAGDRARELRRSGQSRSSTKRKLRDEFGGTHAETDDLIDQADADAPADKQPAGSGGSSSSLRDKLPSPPKSVASAANAGGGLLLGALAYVLALTYLRDGRAGVKRWVRAKFLNKTDTDSGGGA